MDTLTKPLDAKLEIDAQVVFAIAVITTSICMEPGIDVRRVARRLRRSVSRIKPEREITRAVVRMVADIVYRHGSVKGRPRRRR